MMKNLLIIFCVILTSCTIKEVKNSESKINITVTQNQEVLLNGKTINIVDISQKLIDIKSCDTISKEVHYIIHLNVAKNTDKDIVTDIKQQLRKANMLKLKYSSN